MQSNSKMEMNDEIMKRSKSEIQYEYKCEKCGTCNRIKRSAEIKNAVCSGCGNINQNVQESDLTPQIRVLDFSCFISQKRPGSTAFSEGAIFLTACKGRNKAQDEVATVELQDRLRALKYRYVVFAGAWEENGVEKLEVAFGVIYKRKQGTFQEFAENLLVLARDYEQEAVLVLGSRKLCIVNLKTGRVTETFDSLRWDDEESRKYFRMLAKANHRARDWLFAGATSTNSFWAAMWASGQGWDVTFREGYQSARVSNQDESCRSEKSPKTSMTSNKVWFREIGKRTTAYLKRHYVKRQRIYGNYDAEIGSFILISGYNPSIVFRDNVDSSFQNRERRSRLESAQKSPDIRDMMLKIYLIDYDLQFLESESICDDERGSTYFISMSGARKLAADIAGCVLEEAFIYGFQKKDGVEVKFYRTDGRSYPRIHYKEIEKEEGADIASAVNNLLEKINDPRYRFDVPSFEGVEIVAWAYEADEYIRSCCE